MSDYDVGTPITSKRRTVPDRKKATKRVKKGPEPYGNKVVRLDKARKMRVGGSNNMTTLKVKEVHNMAKIYGVPLSSRSGGKTIKKTKGELEKTIMILDRTAFSKGEIRKKYGGTGDAGQGRGHRFA